MILAAASPPPEAAHPLGILDAVLYGLLQGVSEFLPVSSSTHLTLLGRGLEAVGRPPIDEAYVMLFHLPTLAAVLWVLRREIWALRRPSGGPLWALILATAVTAGLGKPLNDLVEARGDSTAFLGCALAGTGLVLLLVERWKPAPREGPWTWDRGLAVGIGQSLAGIPGLSRLGMSTAAGMLTGRTRVQAVVFSFLCAIPVTAGKAAHEVWKTQAAGEPGFWQNRVLYGAYPLGALLAFVAGVATFRWLLRHLGKGTLVPFGIYCAALGALTLTGSLAAAKMRASEPAAAPSARPPGGTEGNEPKEGIPRVGAHRSPAHPPHEPSFLQPPGPPALPPP